MRHMPPKKDWNLADRLSRPAPSGDLPLRCWTIRIHEEVARELEALAVQKRVSINALVISLIDKLLVDSGRPSVEELAPDFVDYLGRRGGHKRPVKERQNGDGHF